MRSRSPGLQSMLSEVHHRTIGGCRQDRPSHRHWNWLSISIVRLLGEDDSRDFELTCLRWIFAWVLPKSLSCASSGPCQRSTIPMRSCVCQRAQVRLRQTSQARANVTVVLLEVHRSYTDAWLTVLPTSGSCQREGVWHVCPYLYCCAG